ncbi:transglutaminase domain-containing protein [Anaerosacchariphilus polymeriproducens]|uniref:Transglutaminase-like domain-containing protein n=1 Tax=Anaerosacchariphilus polymeriproducens TaxID=1812858 RepID=A0A371AYE6_9FIRM|nr:transglutaminase domain-containing protein [Anaerosacchariphilus polymeriproducens]RDU24614.1 hypothetical protein DWV06_03885 [Anaerosacchariphilus polymeriproducens]
MKKFLLLTMICIGVMIGGCSQVKKGTISSSAKEETGSDIKISEDVNSQNTKYDFKYNPYVLSKEFLIKYGKEYFDFYKNFVDAYLNYESSCSCPKEEYSYEVDFLTNSNFLMFNADAYFDNEKSIYDEETKTIHWVYESNSKKEHDRKIKEFENQVATYMCCLQKGDNDFEKTIALYKEFNSRMKYNKNLDDESPYHALMEGTGKCTSFSGAYCHLLLQVGVDSLTNGGFSQKSGGHSWNIVHLDDKDYFMDTTYEVGSKGSAGKGLLYFGMSKEEREEIGGFSIYNSQYGDVNDLKIQDYLDSGNRYSIFRNCVNFELKRNRGCVVYYNKGNCEPKEFYYKK